MVVNVSGTYTLVPDASWDNIQTDEVRLLCDTSLAPVVINLPEISALNGVWNVKILVVDKSQNAAINNITVNSVGGNTIGSDTVEVLNKNGAALELQVLSATNWLATLSAEMGGGIGVSGYSGYSGATGIGTSGYSGYSGDSGVSGYSGTVGAPGVSGYSGYCATILQVVEYQIGRVPTDVSETITVQLSFAPQLVNVYTSESSVGGSVGLACISGNTNFCQYIDVANSKNSMGIGLCGKSVDNTNSNGWQLYINNYTANSFDVVITKIGTPVVNSNFYFVAQG
jgi:hypothetical protein